MYGRVVVSSNVFLFPFSVRLVLCLRSVRAVCVDTHSFKATVRSKEGESLDMYEAALEMRKRIF